MTLAAGATPDILQRATEAVIRSSMTEPLLTPDEGLLRAELTAVAEDVRRALDGGPTGQGGGPHLDRLRLLRNLRSAVLQNWSEDAGALLATMLAFDAIERTLSATDDATATEVLSPFSRNVLREVSHLLRSPLGSIVMLTEMLQGEKSGPLSAAQRHQLDIIYRAALSAAATAGDLLALTSREERFENARRFSVAATVEAVADVVRPVTEARRSELVVSNDVDRHRLGPASAVSGALMGLALRAALMTREGRLELEAAAGDGDVVQFSVTSHGSGAVPADDRVDVLQVFRTGPTSDGYTISQDGLAFGAVREVIRSMGSELHVDTAPDGRLTLHFRIALPVAD